ncbi:MAG TPA: S8 family serine peptidase [Candidatus Saccharimonadales bacterium]|nr:S8 family serine peptidase [Candidatus Saccharimonadales bacterium]
MDALQAIVGVKFMRRLGLFFLLLAFGLASARAAGTNLIVWHKATDRVDADVHSLSLSHLLQQITSQAGWRVYVEPGTTHNTSAKFKNLPSGEALQMLFGDLNFALVPQTNAEPNLYVFTTKMENATRLVHVPATAGVRHAPNELLVRIKPGVNADALAKLYGAKIIGRIDKLGIYRLEFGSADAADAALNQLQNNTDVADVDYNYYLDPGPAAQALAAASQPPVNLRLNPPGNSGRLIVGLLDTAVQPLDGSLNQFLLDQISVAGDASSDDGTVTHGTAMAETILRAMGVAGQGATSAQVLPVDVYGSDTDTTSWYVALGLQAAINKGATVINMSLGGSGDSSILDYMVQQAVNDGIVIFAAAGNQPVSTPTYPAADPGVIAVTASQNGKIAPYANYGSFVNLAAPGTSIVYFGGQPWLVQGTSVSTAYMTGLAAGTKTATPLTWTQIENSLKQNYPVP